MTPEEIKAQAPAGATHYDVGYKEYIKSDNGTWYWWAKDKWVQTPMSDNYISIFIKPL